jgi:hypothetical protein
MNKQINEFRSKAREEEIKKDAYVGPGLWKEYLKQNGTCLNNSNIVCRHCKQCEE